MIGETQGCKKEGYVMTEKKVQPVFQKIDLLDPEAFAPELRSQIERINLHLKEVEDSNRKYKEQMEQAVAEAEEANKAKSTFLFNMSHDIRTPLNSIIGFTELEMQHPDDRVKVAEYRKKVMLASHQLLDILNNILEMSRIENNRVVIEEELTYTKDFFNTWTSVFDGAITKKNLHVTTDCGIIHPYLYVDKTHLSEVYMNVLSNAIKYTPEGGSISLTAREFPGDEPGTCIVEAKVRDTGIGMSEEFLDEIYDRFSRARTSSQCGIQGTGLGMSIAKELITMMHGTIDVKSKLGEGTEVTFRLPHRYGEDPHPDRQEFTPNKLDFKGKRILLAEDIDVNALLAIEILSLHGFEVDRARDGVECVDMLVHSPADYYDLILMDIQMPNLDGYDATTKIRKLNDPGRSGIPIIAMTANAFKEDQQRALAVGMDAHIAKPIQINHMLATIGRFLRP